jgi:uncharacterized protein (UPF0371 family)
MKFVDVKNEEAAQRNWSKEEYDAYIYAGMRAQDKKGRVELAELRAEERKQNALIIAMKSKGIALGMISEITGLDEALILQIIENQQVDPG